MRLTAYLILPIAAFLAQSQEPFRSGVALLELNVGVLDADGQPVPDLREQDFVVRVAGRERKVVLARYRSAETSGGPDTRAADPAADATTRVVPFGANTAAPRGQIVILVIDLETLKAGHEQVMLRTAAQLIESAGPHDAFGLLPIPGKSVDLTRDRGAILRALALVRGTSTRSFRRFGLSVEEARGFEQRNHRITKEVIARECPQFLAGCQGELYADAAELLRHARGHIHTFLTNLSRVATRLQAIDAPKTLVILSGGLPFEQDSLGYFQEAKRQIAAAGITVYAVQLHMPETDASNRRPGGVEGYAASDLERGLSNVATMTGGRFFHGIGTAAGVFARVKNAVSHGYMLGVELDGADQAGKPLDVTVEVRRPKLTVTAPLQVTPREPPRTPALQLAHALAAPVPAAALPLAAAAYVVRGTEAGTLKVIVFGEIQAPAGGVPPHFAFRIGAGERAVYETNGNATAAPGGARVLIAAQVPPGSYTLKLAATDGSRAGTVELPVSVGLRTFGALRISDLITGSAEDGFRPAITLRAGERAAALVEAYGDAPELDALAATAELLRPGADAVLKRADASISKTAEADRRVILAEIGTRGLDRGPYVLRMRVRRHGAELAAVSTQMRIGRED